MVDGERPLGMHHLVQAAGRVPWAGHESTNEVSASAPPQYGLLWFFNRLIGSLKVSKAFFVRQAQRSNRSTQDSRPALVTVGDRWLPKKARCPTLPLESSRAKSPNPTLAPRRKER
jgi:hypothetical protein